ncbi:hypothetical protein [Pyxidicoccus xibeiensis]|uniref:hypothetical protein n=1 Tax=Pyxidicoccus xibeiensis TaxID=2906759 RepID=UPI0020A70322|nr:hypothetical protein [Pyxidicoccus xibeiensis]MCP3143577.1 hypothetical protein [Pyxidicoccus xibeiensis]
MKLLRPCFLVLAVLGWAPAVEAQAPAELSVTLASNAAQRDTIKLPVNYLACKPVSGVVDFQPDANTLKLKAPDDLTAAVEIEASVAAHGAAASRCSAGTPQKVRLRLLRPVLRNSELPLTEMAFDWSSSQPEQLRLLARSLLAVSNALLREGMGLEVVGSPAQGRWTGPCDSMRNVCTFAINAPFDWKIHPSFDVRIVPVDFNPAQLANAPVYRAEDGQAYLSTDFDARKLNNWLARDLRAAVRLDVKDADVDKANQKANVALQHDLLRFLQYTRYACARPSEPNCANLVRADAPSPAARVELSLTNAVVKDQFISASGSVELAPIPFAPAVKLVDAAFSSLAFSDVTLSIAHVACDYNLQQVNRVFGGLKDGWVFYRVTTPEGCAEPRNWRVETQDARLRFDQVRWYNSPGVLGLRFSIPDVDAAASVPLTFKTEASSEVRATALLQIGAPIRWEPASVTVAPDTAPLPGPGLIALRKPSQVSVATAFPEQWRVEIESNTVEACEQGGVSERGYPQTRLDVNGQLCLKGRQESDTAPVMRLNLDWATSQFAVPGSESLFTSLASQGAPLGLGHRQVSLPFKPKVLRLAYPLRELVYLTCPRTWGSRPNPADGKPGVTYVSSNSGIRAVEISSLTERRSCALRFELPLTLDEQTRLRKLVEKRNAATRSCHGSCAKGYESAFDDAVRDINKVEREVFERQMEHYGPQRFIIKLETSSDGKAFTDVPVASKEILLSKETKFDELQNAWLAFDEVEEDVVDVVWEVDLLQGDEKRVPEYGEVKLTLSHAEAPGAYLPATPGGTTNLTPFAVHVRRMPDRLVLPGFAYERASGRGPRMYLSLQIPLGLLRVNNTGHSADTSSEAARMETAVFGAGGVFTLEIWDFNQNEPWSPIFNPQLNFGVLLNSALGDLAKLERPRVSFISGVALRLPGGTKPDGTAESSLSLLLWYEWTRGQVQGWQSGVLFGLGVKFGSLGS